jgi:ubiquinone/menaquinone biosynthesis C-methylase UbiE
MKTRPRTTLCPDRKTHAQRYQQKRYHSLDQAWVNRREQRLMARLLTDCELAGGSVLDVPCGYGRFFPLFSRLGVAITGVDQNWEMLQLAQQQETLPSQRHLVRSTIFSLPFIDNAFDTVMCIRLFHHQYRDIERHRMLCELARVARRYVLISFYRFTPLHAWGRSWAGKHSRLTTLTELELDILAWSSGLQLHRKVSLLRYFHMQTFAVFEKTSPVPQSMHHTPYVL